MEDDEGWRQDPTGRHQERYFRAPGIPTTRVRNNGIEANDEDPTDGTGRAAGQDGLVPAATSTSLPPSGIAPLGTDLTGSTLVASYRVAATETTGVQAPAGRGEPVTSSTPAVVVLREHNWWLIAGLCLLAVLLIATSVFAVQQHNESNSRLAQYRAEASAYHTALHKEVSLYASLVSTEQRLATCVNAANRVLFDVDVYLHSRFLPSTASSDTAAAGQACQTAPKQSGSSSQ